MGRGGEGNGEKGRVVRAGGVYLTPRHLEQFLKESPWHLHFEHMSFLILLDCLRVSGSSVCNRTKIQGEESKARE